MIDTTSNIPQPCQAVGQSNNQENTRNLDVYRKSQTNPAISDRIKGLGAVIIVPMETPQVILQRKIKEKQTLSVLDRIIAEFKLVDRDKPADHASEPELKHLTVSRAAHKKGTRRPPTRINHAKTLPLAE